MTESRGFDPYLDWDKINDDMTDDLYEGIVFLHDAQHKFRVDKNKKNAADMVKASHELGQITEDVKDAIYTQPVMVHVAGASKTEENPEDAMQEAVIQRCKRCGSILQVWKEGLAQMTESGPEPVSEDDMIWWDEGDIVAKTSDSTSMHMYQIEPGRKLERHEMECVSLEDLVFDG